MASIDEAGQWIIMLGFIISIILVFLALIVNQSALIGKTTSESVMEFPKSEIQDLRAEIIEYYRDGTIGDGNLESDLQIISLTRKGVVAYYISNANGIFIHYQDGLTEYNEQA